ncbi:DUF3939 domain-containing protein [Halobacillus sp. A1]|uniref:DUF3939 domain-containing protein n=1 Tax=Halobacillus sp. A1 TaxID=2880262 RepID=UPI0020A62CDC|nr:DUF3939 domain-containing protein [Halobacillus sp. A1]MCP3033507.1 DUF3939 domain-containing protein [Halobacillus sp. A1]
MWKKKSNKGKEDEKVLEVKDLSIHDVRKAIHAYADHKPKEVPLSVIINHDLTIDYHLLSPFIDGIPKKRFYMSKETYELFEEQDQELAKEIDLVQQAVDQYIEQTGETPVIDSDPYKRISYYKLERLFLLSERPQRDFYLTGEEYMITYKKPK